ARGPLLVLVSHVRVLPESGSREKATVGRRPERTAPSGRQRGMQVGAARAILTFLAGAAIALAAACGNTGATGSDSMHGGGWHSVDVPQAAERVAIRGGTAAQRALLKQIVARLHPVALASLTISPVTDKGAKPRPGD